MATQQGIDESKLTVADRANLFAMATRQYKEMLGARSLPTGDRSMIFEVPRVRYLQGLAVLVTAKIKAKGASSGTTTFKEVFSPYDVIRRVSLDLNNGFTPIVVSGSEAALMNAVNLNAGMIFPKTDDSGLCKAPANISYSAAGTSNEISFYLKLPLTLNERDFTGIYLAQTATSNIELRFDISEPSDFITAASGVTFEYESVNISPISTTFTMPEKSYQQPDISMIKILDSRREKFSTGGQNNVNIPVGLIYRKLMLKFVDESGVPLADSDITSAIEILQNTANAPYRLSAEAIRKINIEQLGFKLPAGVLFFDWSNQGVPNLGGSRDYILTNTLTEFALRFTSSKAGTVHIIGEKISKLI